MEDGVDGHQTKGVEAVEDEFEGHQAKEEQEDGGCSRKRPARGIETKNIGLEGL